MTKELAIIIALMQQPPLCETNPQLTACTLVLPDEGAIALPDVIGVIPTPRPDNRVVEIEE